MHKANQWWNKANKQIDAFHCRVCGVHIDVNSNGIKGNMYDIDCGFGFLTVTICDICYNRMIAAKEFEEG